jgi:thymidylate synthase
MSHETKLKARHMQMNFTNIHIYDTDLADAKILAEAEYFDCPTYSVSSNSKTLFDVSVELFDYTVGKHKLKGALSIGDLSSYNM